MITMAFSVCDVVSQIIMRAYVGDVAYDKVIKDYKSKRASTHTGTNSVYMKGIGGSGSPNKSLLWTTFETWANKDGRGIAQIKMTPLVMPTPL